jgi:ubiquinone/menaquinone biosynthesis C-methylase UbiE
MGNENSVREQYDHLAEKYDVRWHGYIASTLSFLKQWAHVEGSESVLDVACGTGMLEQLLVTDQPHQNITGIDISLKMLAVARQKLEAYPNVTFFKANASKIPLPGESFDRVMCANSFHFFDDPIESLAEMKRVLKPHGRIIIMDWCRDYLTCRLCDIFLKIFDTVHKQCYTQNELRSFLTKVKFHAVREQKFKTNLIWGMMITEAVKI